MKQDNNVVQTVIPADEVRNNPVDAIMILAQKVDALEASVAMLLEAQAS